VDENGALVIASLVEPPFSAASAGPATNAAVHGELRPVEGWFTAKALPVKLGPDLAATAHVVATPERPDVDAHGAWTPNDTENGFDEVIARPRPRIVVEVHVTPPPFAGTGVIAQPEGSVTSNDPICPLFGASENVAVEVAPAPVETPVTEAVAGVDAADAAGAMNARTARTTVAPTRSGEKRRT